MRIRTRITAVAAAASLAGLGFVAAPSAFAATNPNANCPTGSGPNSGSSGTNGGVCTASGSISVPEQLALSTDFTTYTVADSVGDSSSHQGNVYAMSNDPSGYYISEATTDYTNTHGTIPASAVTATTYTGGGAGSVAFTEGSGASTPIQFAASSALSGSVDQNGAPVYTGWDSYGFYQLYENGTQPTLPAGIYNGTLTLALWGN